MKAKLHLVLSFSIFLTSFSLWSQQVYWQHISTTSKDPQFVAGKRTQLFSLDQIAFMKAFQEAEDGEVVLYFPDANGKIQAFKVQDRSVMHPDLQAKYPEIRSMVGYTADKKTRIRLTLGNGKLALMIRQLGQKDAFLEKDGDRYRLYARGSRKQVKAFGCFTPDQEGTPFSARLVDDQTLRTYRLAVSTTGEYTDYHGGTVAGALAAINTTVSRINEVFETDLGVRLELVPNNDEVIFTDAATDPYGSSLNSEVQSTLTNRIGSSNYDVGHLFHRDADNGNAGGIGTVCNNSIKGGAFASALTPEGDRYDLDYVAHELGHQFGANHTWSFQSEGTGVQAEPGSGTTIMGYAGITGANNVASAGDDYYHYNSILQMTAYLGTTSCAQESSLVNQPPVIATLPDYIIPPGTAFVLTGNASDPDAGDVLTYCWEQIDNGVVTNTSFGPTNATGANFRSLPPTTDKFRYFPRLSRIVFGDLTQTNPTNGSPWETVSQISRRFNFALTVRDNATGGGQVDSELVEVEVSTDFSPFSITSQESSPTYAAGSVQTLMWNTGGTETGRIVADKVDVYYSVDGGQTFPILIAQGLTNDGEANIQIPATPTTQGRIMIRPQNQIFLAVNSSDITVTQSAVVLNAEQLEYSVCSDSSLDIPIVYETFGGFSDSVNLSVNAPAGMSASLSTNMVSANNTEITLSLSSFDGLPEGIFTVSVQAEGGGESFQVDLQISLATSAPAAVELLAPANNLTGSPTSTSLSWNQQEIAESYRWQIATDAGFSSVVEQGTTSVALVNPVTLANGTTYFWRVSAEGPCGTGAFSEVRTFSTAIINCDTVERNNLGVNISNGAPSAEEIEIPITQNLPISSIAVRVNLNHTFVGDLVLRLRSPQGTTVTLLSGSCGNGEDINALFTDEGSNLVCAGLPVISGDVLPVGSLSAFNGESSQGTWVLEVEDTAAEDGGTVNSVALEYCAEGEFRPDADGDGVFDDGDDLCLNTPPGQEVDLDGCAVYRFAQDAFQIELSSEVCRNTNDGAITITRNANLSTVSLTATLTGDNVNESLVLGASSGFENLAAGTYRLCIDGTQGVNVYEQACFDLEISEPDPLTVSSRVDSARSEVILEMSGAAEYQIKLNGDEQLTQAGSIRLSLKEGVNVLQVNTSKSCQGTFNKIIVIGQQAVVSPNPIGAIAQIYLPQNLTEVKTSLFTTTGQLIAERILFAEGGQLIYPAQELSSGIYLLKIEAPAYSKTLKIIKQ